MYERKSKSGHTVEWNPEHEEEAKQAMSEVVDRFDAWNGVRYSLERETAKDVQERYAELVEERTE